MKRWDLKNEGKVEKSDASKSKISKKKKNMQRLGGPGLSLEAFANAKSVNKHYNPVFKKKQREFYKNAKFVSKYRKSLKQQTQQNDISSAVKAAEDQNQTADGIEINIKNKKQKKRNKQSLEELYEKKRQEEEQARKEREAIIQAKKEEREKAKDQRKEMRTKMFKKTRYGQPVMKYRIEHLLQTIQGSSKNSSSNNT